MSVLSDRDRAVVAAAIRLAHGALTKRREPGDMTPRGHASRGLCVYCGTTALFGEPACEAHTDLPALDDARRAVVTRNTTGPAVGSPAETNDSGARHERRR